MRRYYIYLTLPRRSHSGNHCRNKYITTTLKSGCYTLRLETDEVSRLGASAPRPGRVFAAANTESRKGSPANEVRRHAPRGCRQRRLGVDISPRKKPSAQPMAFFVEMGGLEPPSKHRTRELSTRLVCLWFSSYGCRKTGHRTLIL